MLTQTAKNLEHCSALADSSSNRRYDVDLIRSALKLRVPEVSNALLGEPNRRASSRHNLRFGRHGSLSVVVAGHRAGLWRDHEAGTGGDLTDLIQRETGFDFPGTLKWAANFLGIVGATPPQTPAPIAKPIPASATNDENSARTHKALAIWRNGVPIKGTIADVYLRQARGIDWPNSPWPDDLRFHPRLRLVGNRPALIALIRDIHTGAPKAIQATALKPDGSDRERDERGRISKGPTTGGTIMLTPFDEITLGLGVCEGLETALSVLVYGWPIWATVGTAGLKNFPVLGGLEALTIWADHDSGKERNAGLEAAMACGMRWRDARVEVTICYPRQGGDWNDAARAAA